MTGKIPSPPSSDLSGLSSGHLGFGLGLRIPHYPYIFEHFPQVDFFEIISENFMNASGVPLYNLDRILRDTPSFSHGVCLSLGSSDPLDFDYLRKLKALARRTKARWFSDHLCWTRFGGHHYHDLYPLPYTAEIARYVAKRARIVQDFVELPFGIENLSAVAEFSENQMPEWEFYRTVVEEAGASMMLDVNNIYVSSRNHGFSPHEYLRGLDLSRVLQMHLAGHSDYGSYVLDTHDHPVREEVWELFQEAYIGCGGAATLVEWDEHIPSFPEAHAEILKAKALVTGLTAPMSAHLNPKTPKDPR